MGKISIRRYGVDDKDMWNDFVKNAKNSVFLFDRNFMDYHSHRFTDFSLMFFRDGLLMALLPANVSDNTLYSHGGLTYGGLITDTSVKQTEVDECIGMLIEYAKKSGIERIVYKPVPHVFHLYPAEEDLYALSEYGAELLEVSSSTVINLQNPLKMSKGRKAQISRAKREGVVVKILDEKKDYEEFINLANEVLTRRHGVRAVHTADELYLLHSRFPSNIHLYGAMKDEKMIAGTVVFEYEKAIHTQYMASNDIGRTIGGLDLAVATVINDYKGTKQWLDFGISNEEQGTVLNEGLIAQKESFGGRTNVYTVWEIKTHQ